MEGPATETPCWEEDLGPGQVVDNEENEEENKKKQIKTPNEHEKKKKRMNEHKEEKGRSMRDFTHVAYLLISATHLNLMAATIFYFSISLFFFDRF